MALTFTSSSPRGRLERACHPTPATGAPGIETTIHDRRRENFGCHAACVVVAFVAGGLLWPGGHNPLEPAQFGLPVVIGPNYQNFRDIVGRLSHAEAIAMVDLQELQDTFQRLLTDEYGAREMGERARKVFEREAGATEAAVNALLAIVGVRG